MQTTTTAASTPTDPAPHLPRILLVGDDGDRVAGLQTLLGRSTLFSLPPTDRKGALNRIGADHPDLIVIDVATPDASAWVFLKRVRGMCESPIAFLLSTGLESDRVRALQAGADDVMTTSVHGSEFAARISALVRRIQPQFEDRSAYEDGRIQIDFASRTVVTADGKVSLTAAECRLLAALVWHADSVLSSEQLLEMAWGDRSDTGHGRVTFAIRSVRRKLGWTDLAACPIENVRGFGYRYQSPE